jgi:hypothetical protein
MSDKMKPEEVVRVLETIKRNIFDKEWWKVIPTLKGWKVLIKRYTQALRHAIYCCKVVEEISEKKVRRIIVEHGQLTSRYPDKQHLLAGNNTYISSSQYEDLAQAIVREIKGRDDDRSN